MANLFVWGLTIFVAFGGFIFGYDIGVINGVKETVDFRRTFDLSYQSGNTSCSESITESSIVGLIVSLFSIGCLLGALIAGILSEVAGRRWAIIIGGIIFTVGGGLQAASFFLWMILVGRIVAGIGVGVLSMVVPVYNAEVAPQALRGKLVSLYQLAITAGIMISFLADLGAAKFAAGWRVALGIQCGFGVFLVFGMIFLPETPRWLAKQHLNEKALQTLTKIRGSSPNEVQAELDEIESSVRQTRGLNFSETITLLFSRRISQRILIGVMLQVFQQLTGINVIMYYSTSIFCKIGVAGYISTAVVGVLNFLVTILAVFLVDKLGRKPLLLASGVGMLFSMAATATVLLLSGVGEREEGESVTAAGYAVVVLVCFFVFNFAYGWGPVAWVVTSEIYPLNIRGTAVSITTAANWAGNFLIAFCSPLLLNSVLQTYGTFYILSALLLLATLFVLFTLPETKGESLERIDDIFSWPWLERINLFYYLRCGCPWCRGEQASIRRPQSSGTARTMEMEEQGGDDDRTLLLRARYGAAESDAEASFVIETSNLDQNKTGYHVRQLSTESN